MKAEINFDDYLSSEEKKQIVQQEFRAAICKHLSTESHADRIISNLSYGVVEEIINKHCGKLLSETVPPKVEKIIEEIGTHTVFSKPSVWDRDASGGYQIILDALKKNRPMLEEKVKEHINGIQQDLIREFVKDTVVDILCGAAKEPF